MKAMLSLSYRWRSCTDSPLVSYFLSRPWLVHISDVLFGYANEVFTQDVLGYETHVDRTFNVIASGFQHEKCFNQLENRTLLKGITYATGVGWNKTLLEGKCSEFSLALEHSNLQLFDYLIRKQTGILTKPFSLRQLFNIKKAQLRFFGLKKANLAFRCRWLDSIHSINVFSRRMKSKEEVKQTQIKWLTGQHIKPFSFIAGPSKPLISEEASSSAKHRNTSEYQSDNRETIAAASPSVSMLPYPGLFKPSGSGSKGSEFIDQTIVPSTLSSNTVQLAVIENRLSKGEAFGNLPMI